MSSKQIIKFEEKNKQFKVRKGAWNSDFSKITYWFEDKTRMTISSEDSKYIRPTWIVKRRPTTKPKKPRAETDKTYLSNKAARGWKRLWIPPELVKTVMELLNRGK